MKDERKVKIEFGEKVFYQDREEFLKVVNRNPRKFLSDCEKGVYLQAFKDRSLVVDIIYYLDYEALEDPRLFDIVFRNNIKATLKQAEKSNPTMTTKEKQKIAQDEYRGFCVLVEDSKDKQKLFKEYYDSLIAGSDPIKDADMVVDEVISQAVKFNIVEHTKDDKDFNK